METLKQRLKQLRLPALAAALELRNQYALDHQVSYLEFLAWLLEDEWAARQGQAYHKRLVASRLSSQKLLSTYDFTNRNWISGWCTIWPVAALLKSIEISSCWVIPASVKHT